MSLNDFKEIRDPYAYLCHFCDAQTAKIVKHQAELQLTKEQVVEKVSYLPRLGHSSEAPNNRTQGRPSTDGHNSRRKRPQSESIQMEDEPQVNESVDHNEGDNVEVASPSASPSASTQPESNISKQSSPSVIVSNKCNCIIFNYVFFLQRL